MKQSIRNIVFDMGCVLLAYDPLTPCLRHAGNRQTAIRLRDAIFSGPDWVELDGGTVTEEELLCRAQARLETAELKAAAAEIMKDWHLDALWPKYGMDGVVAELHRRGYPLYILSNAGRRFRSYQYKIPHVELFSGILVSSEERLLKPDSAIYARLCERYGLKPEECLFVDDNQANVEGARAYGMQAYCFADGDVERLQKYLAEVL